MVTREEARPMADAGETRRWSYRAGGTTTTTSFSSGSAQSVASSSAAAMGTTRAYQSRSFVDPFPSQRPPLTLRYNADKDKSEGRTHVTDPMPSRLGRTTDEAPSSAWSPSRRTATRQQHVDASAAASTAAVTTSSWKSTKTRERTRRSARPGTPERRSAAPQTHRPASASDDDDDSYSYSYSYSYTSSRASSEASSSASSVVSFVGTRFDTIPRALRAHATSTTTAAPAFSAGAQAGSASTTAGARRVSFAPHRTELCQSPGGTVMDTHMVIATPLSAGSSTTQASSPASTSRTSAPAVGHGGSHVPTPAAMVAALQRAHQTQRPSESPAETPGKRGARTSVTSSAPTTPAAVTPPASTVATSAVSTGHSHSAANATLSNASRALAVYAQDNQSAAALLRAPPGSVVSAIHTVNLDEEAQRRRRLRAMRESVDDALADALDNTDDDQLLPYPSQLTHSVLPPPPPPPPTTTRGILQAPGRRAGQDEGSEQHPIGRVATAPRAKIPAGCCMTQRRALRRQKKADVRDATRQAVNECLLRSHHVPLIPFETHRNELDWMSSAAPTFAEAAESRWAHGMIATSENPKALVGAMGNRERPGRLSAKTTFAYGRRAGGGPQGGGRSEFLGANDPVLYWASQLNEQVCLRLEPIDTTEVYSYTVKPSTDEALALTSRRTDSRVAGSGGGGGGGGGDGAAAHSKERTHRTNTAGSAAIREALRKNGRQTSSDIDIDVDNDDASDRLAVAAAMSAARAASTSPPALITLTAEGSTTVHATSPALLSVRSHELGPGLTPATDDSRSMSFRDSERRGGAGVGRGLTELSPPRSALARA